MLLGHLRWTVVSTAGDHCLIEGWIANCCFRLATSCHVSFPPTHQLALQGCLTLTVPADVDTEVRLRTLEEDIKSSRKIVDGVPKTENRPEILGLEAKVAAGDVSKKGRIE